MKTAYNIYVVVNTYRKTMKKIISFSVISSVKTNEKLSEK
jgi:hypothetical protein